jgi:hypothetical protein
MTLLSKPLYILFTLHEQAGASRQQLCLAVSVMFKAQMRLDTKNNFSDGELNVAVRERA